MVTRQNLRAHLTGDIRDRDIFTRLNPEGISPDDDNCGDSGAETFTGLTSDVEDAIIEAIDAERAGIVAEEDDDDVENVSDDDDIEVISDDAEKDTSVDTDSDDESLVPQSHSVQDGWYARRCDRDETVHDRVLRSSRRDRLADQFASPVIEDEPPVCLWRDLPWNEGPEMDGYDVDWEEVLGQDDLVAETYIPGLALFRLECRYGYL
jgi:hypothetical protein